MVAPEEIPERLTVWVAASSLIVRLAILFNVGGLLKRFTVTVKVRVTVLFKDCPSLTVTVIVAEPVELAAGVNVKVPAALGLV